MMQDPRTDPSSIGNLLEPFGVTQADIARALRSMLANDQKLGETLVELGAIDAEQLEVALAKQKVLRANGRTGSTVEDTCKIVDYATSRTRRSNDRIKEMTDRLLLAGSKA